MTARHFLGIGIGAAALLLGCAPRVQTSSALQCCAPRAEASSSTEYASLTADASPAAGCKCKEEAGDSCACAFTGSSCGDGAKYCHEVACKGKECGDHCTKKICPTQNTQSAPGQCNGHTRNCDEKHCKAAKGECE